MTKACVICLLLLIVSFVPGCREENAGVVRATEVPVVIDSPLKFADFCGHPEHVAKRRGVLIWIYKSRGVAVSFMNPDEIGKPKRILYSDWDVKRYAEWGAGASFLSPEVAEERLGCTRRIATNN